MNGRDLAILFILCFAILSCRDNDFRTESFILQDSTTLIEIEVPNELDSFYVWIDRNDTHCGHKRKYRISNSSYPVFQESGFFYATYPDSSYRLTFSHVAHLDCYESPLKSNLDNMIEGLKARAERDSVEFIIYSSRQMKIGDIDFYTIEFKTDLIPEQAYPSTVIRSFFNVNNINLEIEFECASKNCDKFLERMNKSLESIRVSRKV